LVLSLLIPSVFYWIFFESSYFEVKDIKISGQNSLSKDVRALFNQNTNFLLFNSKNFIQSIQGKFPLIGDIKIKKEFPNKISIVLSEKKAMGNVCNTNYPEEFFLIAIDGRAFKKTKGSTNLPTFLINKKNKIKIGDVAVDKGTMGDFDFLQKELKKIGVYIKETEISLYDIGVKTKNGFSIYFSNGNEFKIQIEILTRSLETTISQGEQKKLKYIDLRAIHEDGRGEIYFK